VGNVNGYSNTASGYKVTQSYRYDQLSQLTGVRGETEEYFSAGGGDTAYSGWYEQEYRYDETGNMTEKKSASRVDVQQRFINDLNYTLEYEYYEGKSHQAKRIGDRYYEYDLNGNVVDVREGGPRQRAQSGGNQLYREGDLRWTDYGIGLDRGGNTGTAGEPWSRQYEWDDENRLTRSVEGGTVVHYSYGADGNRAVKYSPRGETLYFDAMWQETLGSADRGNKHIYVGTERIATRLGSREQDTTAFNRINTYYYHTDHIGSAQVVTDYRGELYERIEYTPYGELWLEQVKNGIDRLPFRFTGKELDEETGLYYYGARYLDPKTSRWISADPALGEYLPSAPINDEARRRNGNLPGMGGIYNLVNAQLYHYAGNNPVRYTDPDGREGELSIGDYYATFKKAVDLSKEIIIDGFNRAPSNMSQDDWMEEARHLTGQFNEIFDDIGKNPGQFALYTSILADIAAIAYGAFDIESMLGKANDFFKNQGIDVMTQTLTLVDDTFGALQIKFDGAISSENVSLTADNSLSFQFNSLFNISARVGLGVNVPLGPGSRKPDFGNTTLINIGWSVSLSFRKTF
jgi:RHS repeat-associated protein